MVNKDRINWKVPLDQQEKNEIVEYLNNLHNSIEIIKKNRVIIATINSHIREISRTYGCLNNCKISEEVEKILGQSKNNPDLLNKKGKNKIKIIEEHKNTVYDLYENFCDINFNAIKWLESCEIAYITDEENENLKVLGYGTTRLDHDIAYKEANIKLKTAYIDNYYLL